mgnify:CR=1 FL=1
MVSDPVPLVKRWFNHTNLIGNYQRAKRLLAAWRVLVGVWAPRRSELSMGALSHYLTPKTPKPNPWVEKKPAPLSASESSELEGSTKTLERSQSLTDLQLQKEPPVKTRSARRPPSRRLVRHVLRARVEALNALASLFDQLEQQRETGTIRSSAHLVRQFGGTFGEAVKDERTGEIREPQGVRAVSEVLAFLRQKGAKIPTLRDGRFKDDWVTATLSSENEGYSTTEERVD